MEYTEKDPTFAFSLSEEKDCRELVESPWKDVESSDWKAVVEEFRVGTKDFIVSNYRFILNSALASIMEEELSEDTYTMGSYTPEFLSSVLPLSFEVITKLHSIDAYSDLGDMVLALDLVDIFQKKATQFEGYGPYFGSYDGTVAVEMYGYSVFRID